MRSWSLSFLLGVIFFQHFFYIPSAKWLDIILLLIIIFNALFQSNWQWLRLPIACALGFVWIISYASFHNSWTLSSDMEGKPMLIEGYIATIPMQEMQMTSFTFSLKKSHALIKLSWRDNKKILKVGDEWQLFVKLKKPYGLMNPGGFDYEAWAFQEGIRGNGYVITESNNILISHYLFHYPIGRFRQFLAEKLAINLPKTKTSQWIPALVIGERNNIAPEDWQVLRNTGTNHLMAIAGLHIGFMAAVAHFVMVWIWRRIPRLALLLPALYAGAISALCTAFIYSAMAGFSIPTERACFMLSIILISLLLKRNIPIWQSWCLATLCVLLLNPLSILTESVWLSFGSVALIIYGVGGRLAPTGWWWKWGRIQWVIGIGLVPFSIWLFHQCSLISFVANSIAIPVVGCVVVPLSLLGTFSLLLSIKMGVFILMLADKILSILWIILTWFANLPGVVWYQTISSPWILSSAVIAIVFLLLPIGFPGRYFSFIWILPIILFEPEAPEVGEAWLTLLDVGQGLASVVQTKNHLLVFDTGPRFGVNYDMGESVVVPFLHSLAIKKIDMLVISHGDNDHIGGSSSVLRQFVTSSVRTSVPEKIPNSSYCMRGQNWTWDGVNFSFLYPTEKNLNLNNNSSCVLRITVGKKHILLTGDIEKLAEDELVAQNNQELEADILIAPHHGSKTSAREAFINLVHPKFVLFPVGYRNRYHFPNSSVVEKYQDLHSIMFSTAKTGAIQFHLASNHISAPMLYRFENHHFWNN